MATKQDGTSIIGRLNRVTVVVGVGFLACVAISLICITVLNNHVTDFVNNEYEVVSALGDITQGNQGTGRTLCKMILSSIDNDQAGIASYYEDSKSNYETMKKGLDSLSNLSSSSISQDELINALEEADAIPAIIERLHTLCLEGKGMEAWAIYESEYAPMIDDIRSSALGILDVANKSAAEHIAAKDRVTYFAYGITVVVGLLTLVFLVSMTRRTATSISEPISALKTASDRMRQGKLDNDIPYVGDDELGTLCVNFTESCQILSSYVKEIADFAHAINAGHLDYQSSMEFLGDFRPIGESLEQLSITLSDDMAQISASADQVYSGAEQMSSIGTRMSQSAVEQASSVQELVTTVNTVSDHIADNASAAQDARDSANALYGSMTQYSLLMKDVNHNMLETRAMTDQVRGILRNLETISFQTNTLALNAAVEAARAGDAGRGFAVIAGEIRELASEASNAATNTSVIMGDMIAKISTLADMSQHAIGSLDTILADGNTTAASVDKISAASKSQAAALDQVRRSINELSQNIQSISSTAEESAASAEELQGQMKLLNQMVDSFDIRKHS